ncbi:MAG: hypothetical protein JNN15_12815 [Blastocatellia bacterium]|nr:hypothetical protein [Blastocatellia bacterium]
MKLDSDFYHNLLKSLAQHHKPPVPHPMGWGKSSQLRAVMKKLLEDSNARHIFIIERTGRESISYGDMGHIDITELVSLVVGKILACNFMVQLVNNHDFTAASIEGKRWGAYFSAVEDNSVLMVIFDHQTNVDRVAQRVRKASAEIDSAILAAKKEKEC